MAPNDRQKSDCATWLHQALTAKRSFQAGRGEGTNRAGIGTVGNYLLQAVQTQIPVAGQVVEKAVLIRSKDKLRDYCPETAPEAWEARVNPEALHNELPGSEKTVSVANEVGSGTAGNCLVQTLWKLRECLHPCRNPR